jgi:tetratricopeptide (TPR) repeat protein
MARSGTIAPVRAQRRGGPGVRRPLSAGLSLLLALSVTAAGLAAETSQDRCYQAALGRQPARAGTLDWAHTPAAEKLAIVEAGLAGDPGCAYLHYLRGLVLDAELGKPDDALRAFERAVAIIPTFDVAHENIALVHRGAAQRSFAKATLKPEAKEDVFRLTRAVAALRQATEAVAANKLWGKERSAHLKRVTAEVERELEELKAPRGNTEYLDGDLTRVKVTNWRANVRAGFGLAHPVAATLERGDTVAASSHRRYGWVKVRLADGKPGWVYHNLVK